MLKQVQHDDIGTFVTERIYIQPLTLVPSPQVVDGDAVRLGGSMAYAHTFAVTIRDGDKVVERATATATDMAALLGDLSGPVADEAEAQWANIGRQHPPIQCGQRTVRLDEPQVMGILNVTPDSFSDGGKFNDLGAAMRVQAALMLSIAAGALAFAAAEGLGMLVVGRVLLGIGVSAALMAQLKATREWFPAAKVATVAGWCVAISALGGVVDLKRRVLDLEPFVQKPFELSPDSVAVVARSHEHMR